MVALQCGEYFVIAARYYETDKIVSTQEEIKLHKYQNQIWEGEDSERFHLLSQLLVSDLIKTVILYENMIKLTTDIAHTDDPTSTLKLLLQEKTEKVKNISRLYAYEETMRKMI